MNTPAVAIDVWLSPDATFTAVPRDHQLSKIRVSATHVEMDLLFGSLMDADDAAAVCRRLARAATVLAESYETRIPAQRGPS